MTEAQRKNFINQMISNWPSAFVARCETKQFTGGALSAGTIANKETKNHCNGRVVIGSKLCYPTKHFAKWIADNFLRDANEIVDHKPYLHRKNIEAQP